MNIDLFYEWTYFYSFWEKASKGKLFRSFSFCNFLRTVCVSICFCFFTQIRHSNKNCAIRHWNKKNVLIKGIISACAVVLVLRCTCLCSVVKYFLSQVNFKLKILFVCLMLKLNVFQLNGKIISITDHFRWKINNWVM